MDSAASLSLFDSFLNEKARVYFPQNSELNKAITYSLLGNGKRIRPLLCLGFSQAFKGQIDVALRCAVAVEMIHTYSLIHDDLPSMDNDDLRRGRATNHKLFGEAAAILAGDSLLTFAPEFLIKELSSLQTESVKVLHLVSTLLESSGHKGMALGQSLDMKYESEHFSLDDKLAMGNILKDIHQLKTGSLITWSCLAGLHSQNDNEIIQKHKCKVQSIGQRIGLLFQIVDDVLDVVSSAKELGKTPGKDKEVGKLTYTNLYGLDGAAKMGNDLAADIQKDFEQGQDWSIIENIVRALEKKLIF